LKEKHISTYQHRGRLGELGISTTVIRSVYTMCKTSNVTAYCMFSIDARRTLLSGSSFFPSRPMLNCSEKKNQTEVFNFDNNACMC